MKVYIGRIRHRHGDNLYVGKTHDLVFREIVSYVKDEWEGEIETDLPTDLSDEKLVDEYFGKMGDVCGAEEWYEITDSELIEE